MLIGPPGNRKSTAIKRARNIIAETGYAYFSAEKTSKEKFLLDLEGIIVDGEPELGAKCSSKSKGKIDPITEANLWGDSETLKEPREVFIVSDEFNEFAGSGNLDFYTTLGNLWDWDLPTGTYNSRLKNSRSISIYQPTVSILGGNTPANFARAFPAEAGELGFVSRFIFVHGPPTGKKYAFPAPPVAELGVRIVTELQKIRDAIHTGCVNITDHAYHLLSTVYEEWKSLQDNRFGGYNSRRFTQLLKLCIITAVVMGADEITTAVVIQANTMLAAAEAYMPKALGEFGKGRNSDIHDRIITMLEEATKPMSFQSIFARIANDLDKQSSLNEIMQTLTNSGKVQIVSGQGFLPRKAPLRDSDYVDWSLLTEEERKDLQL